jgi:hypothetical protein
MSEIPRQEEESFDQHQYNLIKPDVLKLEHLAEGVKPIMACMGTYNEYKGDLSEFNNIGQEVDYFAHPSETPEDWYRSPQKGYIISAIDSDSKFSRRLYQCTKLVAVGIDKNTGAEISFLTHQDPQSVDKQPFKDHLKKRLNELKGKCAIGTIDVAIAGGQLNTKYDVGVEDYQKSIESLNEVVGESLGFEPEVIVGPKSLDDEDAYFDTKNRRLYLVRPERGVKHNASFKPSQIEDMKEKWIEEQNEKEKNK